MLLLCLSQVVGQVQAGVLSDAQKKVFQEGIHRYSVGSGETNCSTGDSDSGATTISRKAGAFTIDQVKTFASEPVTSTWNISDSTAEQWFLKQSRSGAQATIAKYKLNSGNIGDITSVVKAANVSPAFFYLYTVNEGGGAGGFINHYGGDTSGGGPGNAKRDAEYLATQSKETSGHPATGGGEPSDLPTTEANQILQALPSGSIGVVYIQATSAVTAELEDLSGKTGDWSGKYNKPLSDAMQNIKTMGGDPQQGGSTISTAGCASSGGVVGEGMAKGISFAVAIAKDDGYGYDESSGRTTGWEKWKSDPSCTSQCGSFDCSSFVSAILTVAGYYKTNPNFNTRNEEGLLKDAGFKKVADSATSSKGLLPGDVLHTNGHTEMYIGDGKNVGAHMDYDGRLGDSGGDEISVKPFYTDNWDGVWRASN